MTENKSSNKKGSQLLFFLVIFVAIFAWITYASLEGVLGMLAYIIVGILCIFPWIIPVVGIPLGIMDILGIFGIGMYDYTLHVAHLSSSWMTILWYWIIAIIAIVINLISTILIILKVHGLKYNKKEPKSNLAIVNCNIID